MRVIGIVMMVLLFLLGVIAGFLSGYGIGKGKSLKPPKVGFASDWQTTTQEVWTPDRGVMLTPCIKVTIPVVLEEEDAIIATLEGTKNMFESGPCHIYRRETYVDIYIHYRNGVTAQQAKMWGWRVAYMVVKGGGE